MHPHVHQMHTMQQGASPGPPPPVSPGPRPHTPPHPHYLKQHLQVIIQSNRNNALCVLFVLNVLL